MRLSANHIDDEDRQHVVKQSSFRILAFPGQAFQMVNLYPGQDACDPYDNTRNIRKVYASNDFHLKQPDG